MDTIERRYENKHGRHPKPPRDVTLVTFRRVSNFLPPLLSYTWPSRNVKITTKEYNNLNDLYYFLYENTKAQEQCFFNIYNCPLTQTSVMM